MVKFTNIKLYIIIIVKNVKYGMIKLFVQI